MLLFLLVNTLLQELTMLLKVGEPKIIIRILISRDEIDMPQIKQYYKQLYGKDMVQAVKSDISGDYQKLMIELCDH